nr:hypothetical protein GCM10025699_31410 [Microbacterium flavescens]
MLEVQREAAAAAEAGLDPTLANLEQEEGTDAAPAPSSASSVPASAAPTPDVDAIGEVEAETPVPPAPRAPQTAPIPVADIPEVDVAELGLADRLGLGATDPDDEVGPTS